MRQLRRYPDKCASEISTLRSASASCHRTMREPGAPLDAWLVIGCQRHGAPQQAAHPETETVFRLYA
jgi:hypothetical protein